MLRRFISGERGVEFQKMLDMLRSPHGKYAADFPVDRVRSSSPVALARKSLGDSCLRV